MRKRIDINELIWLLILISLTSFLYLLLKSEFMLRFIHPEMKYLVYFLCIALGVLSIFQIPRLIRESGTEKIPIKRGYLIFIIPIIFMLIVDLEALNPELSDKKGIILVDDINPKNFDHKNITIEITSNNFYKIHEELNENLNQYIGKRIILSGISYKTLDCVDKDYMVGRVFVTCCSADASMLGFLCSSTDGKIPEENEWVSITGTISSKVYSDKSKGDIKSIPLINVEQVKRIEITESRYIYK